MSEAPSRIFGFLCLLVVVWIAAYWLYDPSEPTITFGDRPSLTSGPAHTGLEAVSVTRTPLEARPPEQQAVERLVPPAFRLYTVEAGDTSLEKIAKKLYGDPGRWRAIAEANPFVPPDKLKPGRTQLRIPVDPENTQGRVVKEAAPLTSVPASSGKDALSPPKVRTYTVQKGDTLWKIAKKFYGEGSKWGRIADANKDVLPDPNQPRTGVTIRIPEE